MKTIRQHGHGHPRVLHVGKYFPPATGGIENFLGDLLPALEKKGFKVAAVVHEDRHVHCHAMNREVVKLYRAPSYGTLLYAPVSPCFPRVFRHAIQDFRPDIIHFHVPNTSAFWGLITPCAGKVPWVIHWHADVVASRVDRRMAVAYRLYRPFEQRLLRRAHSIVATSAPYLHSSDPLSGFKEKCRVVSLGLDSRRLLLPDAESRCEADGMWGSAAFRVLVIGRLTYYKGHDLMLQAAAALPDARVLIVGSGEREASLRLSIHGLGLSERVVMPGCLPERKLHALLASCDCLCLPSVERTEAFGLVLLEAMRYGKPVVASNIPGSGIGWVVDDGVTGYLVTPNEPLALTAALRSMAEQPERMRQMGRSASSRFEKVFEIDHIAQQTVLMYHEILYSLNKPQHI